MIGANEPLCNPTLLEERLLGARKVKFFCRLAKRAPPEVVEVLSLPALRAGASQRSCVEDKTMYHAREGPLKIVDVEVAHVGRS